MAKIVRVTWTDPSPTTNVDHLEIWRSVNSGAFAQVGTDLALGVETYDDDNSGPGFADSDVVDYSVRAYNSTGQYDDITGQITISGGTDWTDVATDKSTIAIFNPSYLGSVDSVEKRWADVGGTGTLDCIWCLDIPATGDFEIRILFDTNTGGTTTHNARNIGMGFDRGASADSFQDMDYLMYRTTSDVTYRVNGSTDGTATYSPVYAQSGDEWHILRKTGTTVTSHYYNQGTETLLHTFSRSATEDKWYFYWMSGDNYMIDTPQYKMPTPYTPVQVSLANLTNMTVANTNDYTMGTIASSYDGWAYSTNADLVGNFVLECDVTTEALSKGMMFGGQTANPADTKYSAIPKLNYGALIQNSTGNILSVLLGNPSTDTGVTPTYSAGHKISVRRTEELLSIYYNGEKILAWNSNTQTADMWIYISHFDDNRKIENLVLR